MRIVVGLVAGHPAETAADALRAEGARSIQGPLPSLPGVLVAEFPPGSPAETLAKVAALPGVRYAEPDVMQSTSG